MIPRRFRQFSLRFLLCAPVFVAVLLSLRSLTISSGERDVKSYITAHPDQRQGNPKYYLPFVLECSAMGVGPNAKTAVTDRWYYLWLFGYVRKLPVTRQHIDTVRPGWSWPEIADERLLNRGF